MSTEMATIEISPNEIREIRESLGLKQSEFAERIGVKQAAVSHWEQGIRQPSGAALILIENLRHGKKVRKN